MSRNQTQEVIDIEERIKKWAKDMYGLKKTKAQKKVKDGDLEMKVDWSGVKFVHGEPTYASLQPPHRPKSLVLYKAQYANRTNAEQDYSLSTTRTSKSSCTVELSKAVTTGFDVRFALKTPCQILELNAGFKREIVMETSDQYVTEEELSWSQDTLIKVPANTLTTALLTVREEEYQSSFEVESYFYGRISATFYNKKKGNSFLSKVDDDVYRALKDMDDKKSGLDFNKKPGKVFYTTVGECKFRYGIEQSVELSEQPLADADGSTNGQRAQSSQ